MLSFILIHYCISIFALLPSPSTFVDLLIMLIVLIPFDSYILSFIYIVLARFSDHTFFYHGAVDSGPVSLSWRVRRTSRRKALLSMSGSVGTQLESPRLWESGM